MKLDEAQKQKIAAWIAEGLKLSDIQKRIATELGLSLTYMDTRLLVDDLKLVPSDPARPKEDKLATLPAPAKPQGETTAGPAAAARAEAASPSASEPSPTGAGVSVMVDNVARPGALVSGKVKFSDGQTGEWYMDQMGRLGVVPTKQGYKPAAADVEAFQQKLEEELSKLGL